MMPTILDLPSFAAGLLTTLACVLLAVVLARACRRFLDANHGHGADLGPCDHCGAAPGTIKGTRPDDHLRYAGYDIFLCRDETAPPGGAWWFTAFNDGGTVCLQACGFTGPWAAGEAARDMVDAVCAEFVRVEDETE